MGADARSRPGALRGGLGGALSQGAEGAIQWLPTLLRGRPRQRRDLLRQPRSRRPGELWLVIVDASMTELIRPALYGSYHNIENITSEDEARDKYTIVGTACESTDVFDENVTLRKTRRGDLLTIKSAGAYGMSMASRYNLHDLPGAVYSDEIQ